MYTTTTTTGPTTTTTTTTTTTQKPRHHQPLPEDPRPPPTTTHQPPPLKPPQQLTPPPPPNDPNPHAPGKPPHSLGDPPAQHAAHATHPATPHRGLPPTQETRLFYALALPSWLALLAAAATGPYYRSATAAFAAPMAAFMALHWAAWLQTAIGMLRRASWVREEADLVARREFLSLAVRLNRLMMPTALIALPVFIQAYVRRDDLRDLPYWLLFLLIFIWNTVFSVMNAYNNITWESDRLRYEEGEPPFRSTRLAILGIPTTTTTTTKGREGPVGPKGD